MMDLFDIAVLILLVFIAPLMGIWEKRKLAGWVRDGRPGARMRAYSWIIGFQWIVTALVLTGWRSLGRDSIAPTAVFESDAWGWGGLIAAVVIAGALIIQLVMVRRSPGQLEQAREQAGTLAMIAPRTSGEARTWDILSVTAGVCEEILYRGVFMLVIAAQTGPWVALLMSSLVFGLGHVYQGPVGILRTGLVGLVLGLLVLLTGSLLPAMLVHAVLDITSGRMLSAAVTAAPPVETASV